MSSKNSCNNIPFERKSRSRRNKIKIGYYDDFYRGQSRCKNSKAGIQPPTPPPFLVDHSRPTFWPSTKRLISCWLFPPAQLDSALGLSGDPLCRPLTVASALMATVAPETRGGQIVGSLLCSSFSLKQGRQYRSRTHTEWMLPWKPLERFYLHRRNTTRK